MFYVNASKEKNGVVPIMGRVTINGTIAQFSCKQTIPKALWDAKGNRAKGKSKEAQAVNFALDNIKAQIVKHYQRLSDREACVTAEMVRNVKLKGDFYSPEFNRKFHAEGAAFSFEKDKCRTGHFRICVNDIPLVQWFRQKAHEWRNGLGITTQKQSNGMRI